MILYAFLHEYQMIFTYAQVLTHVINVTPTDRTCQYKRTL